MKYWRLKLAAAFGIVAGLGYWKHKGGNVRNEPYLRERVDAARDEVFSLSELDCATDSVPPPDHEGFVEVRARGLAAVRARIDKRRKLSEIQSRESGQRWAS